MTKKIAILGSTGSIGIQTLEVARNIKATIVGLSTNVNIKLLEKQAREFKPHVVAVGDTEAADILAKRLKSTGIKVLSGMEGMIKVATADEVDMVVTSVVGSVGLLPTIEAIRKGKDIALANKETLVAAGSIVMSEAQKKNVRIVPVDSEHSAIFQCLAGNDKKRVRKIILTASGGPFRGKTRAELEKVLPEDALKHPNWLMGNKITVDSATLMNKGLEMIEARWLFDLKPEQIEVMVHPQSVIHSMVEYVDGSVIAQLGPPDMRIPIQYALTYPEREENSFSRLNLLEVGKLTFEEPDPDLFPCLKLAFSALKAGGTMPAVMNAANEVAVEFFLRKEISFMDIPVIIERVMKKHKTNISPNIYDIIEVDKWARDLARTMFSEVRP